nr:type VI secretion system tip protein VgrG [Pseudenhygromyxa sp. WMMC2535]
MTGLEIRRELNRVPEAKLVFYDGHDEKTGERVYALSNAADFAPGAEIELGITRDKEDQQPLFSGKVLRHAVEAEGQKSSLRVELKDVAFDLTGERHSEIHREQSDKQIISTLISRAPGVGLGQVPSTKPVHEELLQYQCSDWDFILSRADVLGLLVAVEDGSVSLHPMGAPAKGAQTHSYVFPSNDILELELEIDGGHQNASFEAVGWNAKQKARLAPTPAGKDAKPSQGDQSPAEIGKALGLSTYTLEAGLPLDPDELSAWAKARLARSRMAMIRGRVRVLGKAPIKLLDSLALTGVGERFDGSALITGIIQRYDNDGWTTELELGLDPQWYARTPELVEPPAAGLLPPIAGLQLGVVEGYKQDASGEHRVQVALPMVPAKYGAIWARLTTPDAGPGRGFLAWPELGDEVVVAFLNQDPRQAVILGSTFSSVNAPPARVGPPPKDAAAAKRIISTAKGLTILFDEERPALTIETKAGNKIELDDSSGAEAIVITDKHKNSVAMTKDGVTITSAKDLTLTATGDVTIKGASVDLAPS